MFISLRQVCTMYMYLYGACLSPCGMINSLGHARLLVTGLSLFGMIISLGHVYLPLTDLSLWGMFISL